MKISRGHGIYNEFVSHSGLARQTREHSISQDRRVADARSAASSGRDHTIHSDQRVAAPEIFPSDNQHELLDDRLVESPEILSTEQHEISQDAKLLSPAEGIAEVHDLHADGRVRNLADLPPKQHSIASDTVVTELLKQPEEHQIPANRSRGGPSLPPPRRNSPGAVSKLEERANQLLGQFLDEAKK